MLVLVTNDLDIPRLQNIVLPDSFNRVRNRNIRSPLLLLLLVICRPGEGRSPPGDGLLPPGPLRGPDGALPVPERPGGDLQGGPAGQQVY